MFKIVLAEIDLSPKTSAYSKPESNSFKDTFDESNFALDREEALSSESQGEKVLNSVMQWFENKGIRRGDAGALKDELRHTKEKVVTIRPPSQVGRSSLLERRLKSKLSSIL